MKRPTLPPTFLTERATRIELAIEPWEGSLLPLQHARDDVDATGFCKLAPIEFSRGLLAVAADAPHVALRDLVHHEVPFPIPNELRDIVDPCLARTVIEVEQDRVGLAAVDAGMGAQILETHTSLRAV